MLHAKIQIKLVGVSRSECMALKKQIREVPVVPKPRQFLRGRKYEGASAKRVR